MFKKLCKIIGSFFLVLILLFIVVGIWFSVSSSNHVEKATPYINRVIPIISSWNYNDLQPNLTDEAQEFFETEQGKKIFEYFSKLGEFKSFEAPIFSKSMSGITIDNGSYDMVSFTVITHFNKGDALITLTLAQNNNEYKIHNININSDVFLD
jgi:hypothetical protein